MNIYGSSIRDELFLSTRAILFSVSLRISLRIIIS